MWAREGSAARNWSRPDEEPEIIRITALNVEIRKQKVEIIDSPFDAFVRPIIHPMLPQYIQKLTHITQRDVDTAATLEEVMPQFREYKSDFYMTAHGVENEIFHRNFDIYGLNDRESKLQCINLRDWLYGPVGLDPKAIINGESLCSGNLSEYLEADSYMPDHIRQIQAHQGVKDVYSLAAMLEKLVVNDEYDFEAWALKHCAKP